MKQMEGITCQRTSLLCTITTGASREKEQVVSEMLSAGSKPDVQEGSPRFLKLLSAHRSACSHSCGVSTSCLQQVDRLGFEMP